MGGSVVPHDEENLLQIEADEDAQSHNEREPDQHGHEDPNNVKSEHDDHN